MEENAVLLPDRIPGFKKEDIQLLPSSETKMSVWRQFKKVCEESGKDAVCYTKFIYLWEQFHPNVVVTKPMSDLCVTCQQNTSKLVRSANLPDRCDVYGTQRMNGPRVIPAVRFLILKSRNQYYMYDFVTKHYIPPLMGCQPNKMQKEKERT